jgi:hypothetical protein
MEDDQTVADRPAVVVESGEPGMVAYRASALGSCTRALAAARQELEPWRGPVPGKMAETFARGHAAEETGVKWFMDRGWIVSARQQRVEVRLTGRLSIVGHIDFITQRPDCLPTIVDTKSQSEEEFRKASIRDSVFWHKYVWQFSSYVAGLQMPIAVQRICGDDVALEFIPGEWLYDKSALLGRVLEVELMATTDLKQGSCDRDDFPCPYFHLFHPRTEEMWEEREDTELADLALHYNRLGVEIEPLEKRKKEIRAELLKRVGGDEGYGRVRETTSGIEIRVTTASVKERHIPAGSMVRLGVHLPDESGSGSGEAGG